MPIYEYQCRKCGKTFEYMQGMSEPPKTKCEACKGKLERLISRTSFQLKGAGWYSDLYASPKQESSTGGDKDSGAQAPSSSASEGGSASGSASGTSSSSESTTKAAPAAASSGSDAKPKKKSS